MTIESPLTKRYYSMGEVCTMLDVAPSLIRHWETVFDDLHTRRGGKGDRRFTPDNIKKLVRIFTLVKEQGYTLDGAKMALQIPPADIDPILQRLRSLKQDMQKLLEKLADSHE